MNEERGKIMGINCLEEVLKTSPRRIVKAYVARQKQRDSRKERLIALLKENKIEIQEKEFDSLTSLVGSDSHQGFIAEVKRYFFEIESFLEKQIEKDRSLILVLDSIFDPHNVGAILRAGECFGVDGVLFSKNRGCDITAVVSKVSSGASELLSLVKVSNLAESVKKFQKEDFSVIVAEGEKESSSLTSFSFPSKSLLILGSEGEGVQPLLKKMANFSLKIPLMGQIDSLNVSQAAAIFLYHWQLNLKNSS
jgi:23S rRNA (guanosine2251-2'-O)-methyltransferase